MLFRIFGNHLHDNVSHSRGSYPQYKFTIQGFQVRYRPRSLITEENNKSASVAMTTSHVTTAARTAEEMQFER